MLELHEQKTGLRVRGLVAAADVITVAVEPHGDGIVNVVFRLDDGQIADRLVTTEDAARIEVASERRWTFDADSGAAKLKSNGFGDRTRRVIDENSTQLGAKSHEFE